VLGRVLLRLALAAARALVRAALWIDGPASRWLAGLLAGCSPASRRLPFRPRAAQPALACCPAPSCWAWWFSLRRATTGTGTRGSSRLPTCSWQGEVATISNVQLRAAVGAG